MNTNSLLEEELSLAGEASPVTPLVIQLDKFRIMSDTDVPPEAYQIRTEKAETFTQKYIIHNDGQERSYRSHAYPLLTPSLYRPHPPLLKRGGAIVRGV